MHTINGGSLLLGLMMANSKTDSQQAPVFDQVIGMISGLPWLNIFASLYQLGKTFWQKKTFQGMYEVLEHKSTLELLDNQGKKAIFHKRQKVRYLQDYIIAYQDQAWGDGEILLDYRCTPGTAVDFYRPGNKTYILISLRGVKKRGDTDFFDIQWKIRNGFLRTQELWETEINHITQVLRVVVIFPRNRPPIRAWLIENIRQKTLPLGG